MRIRAQSGCLSRYDMRLVANTGDGASSRPGRGWHLNGRSPRCRIIPTPTPTIGRFRHFQSPAASKAGSFRLPVPASPMSRVSAAARPPFLLGAGSCSARAFRVIASTANPSSAPAGGENYRRSILRPRHPAVHPAPLAARRIAQLSGSAPERLAYAAPAAALQMPGRVHAPNTASLF